MHPPKSVVMDNLKLVLITLEKWINKKIHKWGQDGGFYNEDMTKKELRKMQVKKCLSYLKKENQGNFDSGIESASGWEKMLIYYYCFHFAFV